jgi:hypothetical protein
MEFEKTKLRDKGGRKSRLPTSNSNSRTASATPALRSSSAKDIKTLTAPNAFSKPLKDSRKKKVGAKDFPILALDGGPKARMASGNVTVSVA